MQNRTVITQFPAILAPSRVMHWSSTTVGGWTSLECCYSVMGGDHTDHPFGSHRIAAELVERLACSPADRELVYHGNAERLFGLSDRTGT